MRLVFVTRQFWPLVGGAQVVAGNLAAALQRQGSGVTLLTAQWKPQWPQRFVHQGVNVVRLPQPRLRFWGTWQYMRALSAWLHDHAGEYDLVYVSMLKHDAYATLGAVDARRVPVVLRPELAGCWGDVRWQQGANFGPRIAARCRQATALVAVTPWVEEELINSGYPAARIHRIANGVEVPPERTEASRRSARADLRQANGRLRIGPDDPLAVYTGRLHESKGLETLVSAWSEVARLRPGARLWLVGDGPLESALRRQAEEAGLANEVVLAGRFDSALQFYQAADLFLLPSHEEMMSISLLEAMAAGLPVVASDIRGNRNLIDDGHQGRLVPPGDAVGFARAILAALDEPAEASRWAEAARARVVEMYSVDRVAADHLRLFEQLVRQAQAAHVPA